MLIQIKSIISRFKTPIFFNQKEFKHSSPSSIEDDNEALKKDWEEVGNAFRTVLFGTKKKK